MLSRSDAEDDQVSTMMMARASALASTATLEISDASPSLSDTFSSTTSIVYSDVPSSVARDDGSSSYRGLAHHINFLAWIAKFADLLITFYA